MGVPSGCKISVPLTEEGVVPGTFNSVVPLAVHPPPDGAISNSSWATVLPSTWMANLPLSATKIFGAAEVFWLAMAAMAPAKSMEATKAKSSVLYFGSVVESPMKISPARKNWQRRFAQPVRRTAEIDFAKRQHDISWNEIVAFLRRRFLDYQMGLAGGAGKDAEAQHLGYDLRGIAGAFDAEVGGLVGGETLGVERAETLLVAEEWAAGHGHTAAEQDFCWGIQPKHRDGSGAKKFWTAGLRVSAAA